MATHVICGCGLQFKIPPSGTIGRTHCPVCSRVLKTPSGAVAAPVAKRVVPHSLMIGLTLVALLGVGGVAVAIAVPMMKANPVPTSVAVEVAKSPAAPSQALLPVAAPVSSEFVDVEHEMLPVGPIGGGFGQ